MTTKMKKGLLKPLRYISQMFDGKEHELQIGYPTDVKHVAHIGWDGPNVNAPSWMKDFHSAPLSSAPYDTEGRESPPRNLWASQEINFRGGLEGSPMQQESVRPYRSSTSHDPAADSPGNSPKSSKPRHSRRHLSDGTATADSPNRDRPSDRPKKGRRHRRKEGGPNGPPTDAAPAAQELPAIPKQSHRRRIKGSGESGGGSTRPSRLKDATASASPPPSPPSVPHDAVPEARPNGPVPVLKKPMNEEEEGL